MKHILLVILCIVIYGCQPPYNGTEEKPHESWTEWTDGQLVSIINDSLAVMKICKYKKNTWYEWGFEGSKEHYEITDSRVGLFIVNYRNKQKPLFGDTLSYDLRVVGDYYKNSSVLVFDKNNSQFGFWKIEAKSVEFKKYSNSISCRFYVYSYNDVSLRARPWINGKILLAKPQHGYGYYYDGCPISLLDIESGEIERFDFSGEYEWLSECNDMSYIGNKIVCIRKNNKDDNLELVVDGMVADVGEWWYNVSNWYGNYIKNGNGYDSKGEVRKIDTLNFKFENTLANVLIEYTDELSWGGYDYQIKTTFEEDNNFIVYKAEDLIGKKYP